MFLQGSWTLPSFLSANPDFNVEFTILPNDNGKPIATQAVDTGFCVNAKVADEPEKMEAIDKFLSFALSAEGAQIYTDNDKSPSCVTGVKAEVPQFQPFFDYVEANGFEADGAYPPTGFEDTKRGKIQNVLLDKDVDAFLKEMTNDWNQAVGLLIYRHAINEGKFSTSVAESMILFVIVGVVSAFSLRLTSNKQVGE